jgi:hypothetical protein
MASVRPWVDSSPVAGVEDEIELARLAGRHDLQAKQAAPGDKPDQKARLVPVGRGIDDAGLPRPVVEQRPDHAIGLFGDHDDMLAAIDCKLGDGGCRLGMTGRLDDHVDRQSGQDAGFADNDRAAAFEGRHCSADGCHRR